MRWATLVTIDMGRKQGAAVHAPFAGGELGPHPTSAPRSTSVPVASLSIHQFGHNRHGPKTGGRAPFRRSRDPSNTTSPGPRHLGPSTRLATIDMGQKLGGTALFSRGRWVPIEHKVAWAEAYLHTKWHLNQSSRLATTDIGRKLGAVPFRGGRAGSPPNTMSPMLRLTSVPSGTLTHTTAVWPQ